MKATPNLLKLWLPVFLCVGLAPSVQADPWVSINGNYSVGYTQTTSGTTTAAQYSSSLFVSTGNYGNFDPVAYFPTSVSFAGSAFFPGGQLDVGIDYSGSSTTVLSGPNYYGLAGGAIFSPPPDANGYMWGSGGVWSQNFSEVQSQLSATLHGGALDGLALSTSAFDLDLLPTAPLFTLESLAALGSITGSQDLALALVLPFSPGFSNYFSLSELVDGQYNTVMYVNLDPILNPTGFNIPGSIFLPGHDYVLSVGSSATLSSTGTSFEYYQANNSVFFSVASTSVPDPGTTVALFGSALVCLGLVRRRLLA